jgi:hypothetical protein
MSRVAHVQALVTLILSLGICPFLLSSAFVLTLVLAVEARASARLAGNPDSASNALPKDVALASAKLVGLLHTRRPRTLGCSGTLRWRRSSGSTAVIGSMEQGGGRRLAQNVWLENGSCSSAPKHPGPRNGGPAALPSRHRVLRQMIPEVLETLSSMLLCCCTTQPSGRGRRC